MIMKVIVVLVLCGALLCVSEAKLKGDDCEVCIGFLQRFERRLKENGMDSTTQAKVELELMKICKEAKGKDDRFCYYIGAADISATKLVNAVTRPMSFGKPVEKICEELKKMDSQICELRYDKEIDWANVELKKLKVRELRKILSNWEEECKGCAEKSDFIEMIERVKSTHVKL